MATEASMATVDMAMGDSEAMEAKATTSDSVTEKADSVLVTEAAEEAEETEGESGGKSTGT